MKVEEAVKILDVLEVLPTMRRTKGKNKKNDEWPVRLSTLFRGERIIIETMTFRTALVALAKKLLDIFYSITEETMKKFEEIENIRIK